MITIDELSNESISGGAQPVDINNGAENHTLNFVESDEFTYYCLNPDVWMQKFKGDMPSPGWHYRTYGRLEGRQCLVDTLWSLKDFDLTLLQALSPSNSAIRNLVKVESNALEISILLALNNASKIFLPKFDVKSPCL